MNVTPKQAVMQAHSVQDCVNAIGEALHGKPNGNDGFNSCDCPVHGGHNNLSVDVGDKPGKLLLRCHAGCEYKDIEEAIKRMGLPLPGPASPSFAPSPEQVEARKKKKAQEEARKHAAAAEEAARIFKQASPDWREHPYAKKKGAVFGGLDQNPQRTVFKNPRRGTLPGEDEQNPLVKDAILFPLKEHLLGDVQTLLAIAPNGRKFLLKGGKKKGCFYFFNSFHDNPPVLYIGEGVATVGAVWRATGGPCIAAGDAGNMVEIAKRVRQPAPRGIGLPWKREIIILADEDVGGLAAAAKAARLAGGKIARPQAALDTDAPKRYDFWDLWHEHQESAVRLALSKAEPPPPESAKKKEASPLPASFAPPEAPDNAPLDGADAPFNTPPEEAPPPWLADMTADEFFSAPSKGAEAPPEDEEDEADTASLRETVAYLAGLSPEQCRLEIQGEAKNLGILKSDLAAHVRMERAKRQQEEAARQREEEARQAGWRDDDPEVEGEGLPKDFHLHQSGLWHYHVQTPEEAAKTGITMQRPPARTFIGPPLLVVAGVRDLQSDNWSKLLQWHDRKGVKHQWVLPDKLLHAKDPAVWIAPLASGGWSGATNKAAKELLKLYLISCRPPDNTVCVSRTGWHRGAYVFPNDETLYPADSEEAERFVLQTNRPCNNPFAQKGSLEAWQATIGKWAQGNSRLVLALSAALAATLLEVCGLESGGFHLVGTSSEGKTTALFAAASVWGPGNREGGYIRSWRATDNGLEGTAALHSDALLCLDEIGQAPARVIEEAAYMLANGTGKGRARQDGTAREAQNWRCLILSTGEESLVDCIRAGGGRVKAGQQVRLLDIPATADMSKPDWGIVENLHGHEDTKGFIHAVEDAAKEAYGTAAQAFIRKVQEHGLTELAQFWRRYREATLERLTGKNASGQVKRAGERFLLCAFAGEKATEWGILPWKKGEAMKGVQTCFRAWIAQRGGKGAAEDLAIVQQVRLFLEQHGSSRFQDFDSPDEKCQNRAGFKEKHGDTLRFFVLPEVFKRELVPGYDPKRAGKVLYEAGMLEKPEDPQAQMQRMTLPGMGRQRCYVLSLPQADREKED